MINVLELLEKYSMTIRKGSSTKGGEYHSACPGCGDGGKGLDSDRFHVWPAQNNGTGSYWCRQCGKNGDNIQFLRDFEGLSYKDACNMLGIETKNSKSIVSRPLLPQRMKNTFSPSNALPPSEIWMEHAEKFVSWAQDQLIHNDDALAWLSRRGITQATAAKYRLGYNPGKNDRDLYRNRQAWGLPVELDDAGKKKTLWLPRGWVIPQFDTAGRVVHLRIRRRDKDREKFLSSLKYLVVQGSSHSTMILSPGAPAFTLVESGFCAILIDQELRGICGAITTWNASAKPDRRATEILRGAAVILDALDYDQAGRTAATWWSENFRNHKRWPVPEGKDPGEAYEAGIDIAAWIKAGLPAAMVSEQVIKVPGDHQGLSPGQEEKGSGAQKLLSPSVNTCQTSPPGVCDSEIMEMLALLEKIPAKIDIGYRQRSLHLQIPRSGMTPEKSDARRRLSQLVFYPGPASDLLGLLWEGIYDGRELRKFYQGD